MENVKRHKAADALAQQMVIELVRSIQSKDGEGAFDMSGIMVEGETDVTALFEGILMATAYMYKTMIDSDSDLMDMISMFNRIAVARIVDTKE